MDFSCLVSEAAIQGEDAEETEELLAMLARARNYISSFDWCPPIAEIQMGFGIGGVVAVFLVRFAQPIEGDEYLWVVEGDVPSAYLVTDDAENALSALEIYCQLMEEWVTAVENEESLDGVFPVNAPPDNKHATMLRSRLDFINTKIWPNFRE